MIIKFTEQLTPDQEQMVIDSPKFSNWLSKLTAVADVERIDIFKVNFFGKKVGFVYCEAISTVNGKSVPGITFIRGDSVAVLVVFNCEGEKFVLTTNQFRVPIAEWNVGLVAGMVDDSNCFKSVALKEFIEETGLDFDIKSDELEFLYDGHASSGGSDEFSTCFCYERDIDKGSLNSFIGTIAGNKEENEHIVIDIIKLEDVKKLAGARSQLAYYKYIEMRGQNNG